MGKQNRATFAQVAQPSRPTSGYAAKQALKAQGLWEPPEPDKHEESISSAVAVALNPASATSALNPLLLNEHGAINQRKWWPGRVKVFQGRQNGWVTVDGVDYYLEYLRAKVAGLYIDDLYPNRDVMVRLRPGDDGIPMVRGIKLPDGT